MPRITKNNYLQTLQETINALIVVGQILHKNRKENRAEISEVSSSIRSLRSVLHSQQKKHKETRQNLNQVMVELTNLQRAVRSASDQSVRDKMTTEIQQLEEQKKEYEKHLKE